MEDLALENFPGIQIDLKIWNKINSTFNENALKLLRNWRRKKTKEVNELVEHEHINGVYHMSAKEIWKYIFFSFYELQVKKIINFKSKLRYQRKEQNTIKLNWKTLFKKT